MTTKKPSSTHDANSSDTIANKASDKKADSQRTGSLSDQQNNSLANTALYRKHRPQDWQSVSGQAHIVSILEAEAKKEYPSHAFLFAGSRGTGKTTLARIFAKNIGTAPEDIYEIDAASNTSVEDIRVLNEAVYALPMNSKFKVYILDEVHMLSKSAFNAFLKTLEEPPKHVIFILATTELHKIPETIISRCQVFHFKKPSIETLREVIAGVSKKEGVKIEEGGLDLIAHFGNGSFRDTLSSLQTVIGIAKGSHSSGSASSSSKTGVGAGGSADAKVGSTASSAVEISTKEIEEFLGAPSHIMISDFVDATLGSSAKGEKSEKDIGQALQILQTIHATDMDVRLFTDMLIHEFRARLLSSVGAGSGSVGGLSNSGSSSIGGSGAMSSNLTGADCVRILDLLLTAKGELGKTHISILPLELALFKFFSVK